MADLRNGEVAVDIESNSTKFGPSGTKARKSTSCYLLVGGSANTYKVTISTAGAHFCVDHAGNPCKGNTFGKAKKYGSVHARDRSNPVEWCKHVSAAMGDTEAIAEAQDLTAIAFGQAEAVKATPKPAPVAKPAPTVTANARERLAAIEAEAATLRSKVEVTDKVVALVDEYGFEAVKAALGSTAIGTAA
jgi:hypothetical protein